MSRHRIAAAGAAGIARVRRGVRALGAVVRRRSPHRLLEAFARRKRPLTPAPRHSPGFLAFRVGLVLGVLAFGFLSADLLLDTVPMRSAARSWAALGHAISRHESRIVALAIDDPRAVAAPDAAWRHDFVELLRVEAGRIKDLKLAPPVDPATAPAPTVLAFLDEARESVRRAQDGASAELDRRWAELYALVIVSLALAIVALVLLERNARARVRMAELDRRATRDPLTGVLNRRALLEYGEREIPRCARRGEPMALLLLDIDRFKAVNDGHGHAAGDRLVQEVAARLGRTVRPYDALGRWGGDEFLIVLPGCDRAGASQVAERIVETMRLAMPEVAPDFTTSVSVGVAVASLPFCSLTEMIDAADAALYRAKAAGRDGFHVADAGPRRLAAGPAPEHDELLLGARRRD